MYCNNCGNKIKEGEKFCSQCGSKVNDGNSIGEEKKIEKGNPNITNTGDNSKLGQISKIIGIIAIVLAVVINLLALPIAIVGFILGIIHENKTHEKTLGIVLNAIAFPIAAITSVIWFTIFFEPSNPVVGVWDCKGFLDSNYTVTMQLKKDKSFVWSKYGDMNNNYVNGTYTSSKLDKTNYSGEYSYYSVILDGDEYVINGIVQDEEYGSRYEMGVGLASTGAYGNSVLYNLDTGNMYYCTLRQ